MSNVRAVKCACGVCMCVCVCVDACVCARMHPGCSKRPPRARTAGLLRLRGGGQGWYMDEVLAQQKRGRVRSSQGEGKDIQKSQLPSGGI
jgi:hypothetical protein